MTDAPMGPDEIARRARAGEITPREARRLLLATNPPKAWERAIDPRKDPRRGV